MSAWRVGCLRLALAVEDTAALTVEAAGEAFARMDGIMGGGDGLQVAYSFS